MSKICVGNVQDCYPDNLAFNLFRSQLLTYLKLALHGEDNVQLEDYEMVS